MVDLSQLISHRFRGFAKHENTIDGCVAALDFGVLNLEFDIRISRCGTPMIYHDEYARGANRRKQFISETMARDFEAFGGVFSRIPMADVLFREISQHANQKAKLLIDIKDAGFEDIIHALVCAHNLQNRTVYVSWLPNVLYAMSEIAPNIPLCLSHWCKNPSKAVRLLHKVHKAENGHVKRLPIKFIHGERSGWFVDGPLSGSLRDIIKTSGGSVCVPQGMASKNLVEDYQRDGIEVSTFSYTKWGAILAHKDALNIDLYFIDNKTVFDAL